MWTNEVARHSRKCRWALVLAGIWTWPGCSFDDNAAARVTTFPVSGSVVMDDGKPLTGGTISFVPKEKTTVGATGKIAADGTFKLTTYSADDGAAEGTYKVRVEPVYEELAKGKKGAPKMPFSSRFTDEDTSGLTVEVKPGENKLPPLRLDNKALVNPNQFKDRD